jgi:hypothetical protein
MDSIHSQVVEFIKILLIFTINSKIWTIFCVHFLDCIYVGMNMCSKYKIYVHVSNSTKP